MSTVVVRRPTRRPEPEYPSGDIVLDSPPELPQPSGRGWAGMLMALPMLTGAAAMALMYSRFGGGGALGWVTGGLFGMSAIGMLAVSLGQQSGGPNKREMMRMRRAYLRHLGQQRTRVRKIITRQRTAAFYRNPDPASLWSIAASSRLWERRPADADFLQVRIGLGAQELATPILPPASKPLEDLEPMCALALRRFITTYAVLPGLPLVMAVDGFATVYLRGAARGLCRAVLAHLVLFHAPDDLLVAVCAGPGRREDWDFVKWLPHGLHPIRTDAIGPVRLHAPSVVELEALLDDVVANRPRFAVTQAQARPPGPHVVVVLDGGERAGSEHLLADGGIHGVTVIDLDGPPPRVLDPARLVLDVGADGTLTSTTYDGTTVIGTADALHAAEAEAVATQLAPLRLSVAAETESQPLGGNLELADLLGMGDPRTFDPMAAWVGRPARARLRVPIGVDPDGSPVELDLKESAQDGMGPHGLVIGATGSGKSELLRTLVLALAATHDPATLNFVLVDFKGGATFATLDRLPHTSAVITNLADELPLVDRMKDAITGELIRRQEMLRGSGNFASLHAYERARVAGAPLAPLPSLMIVCDEFSELLTAKPDFIEMFVQIGRLGRSMGVHLLLASQRLEEGRLRGLDSQLSYRIGLRTFSGVESRAVLGVPDAYHLPRSPGHGYLKFGTEPMVRFKAAYVSGVHRPPGAPPRLVGPATPQLFDYTTAFQPEVAPPTAPVPDVIEPDPGDETLLDVLVGRLRGRGAPAHRVWLPPLRESPGLDDLLPQLVREPERGITVGNAEVRGRLTAPVGIVDKPVEQRRDLLLLDLSGAAGHVLIVGGPQSGKSTLLRTLVLSFAVTHTAREAQFYCLDFGVGALTLLRDLPHVGGVATRRDPGHVRRTVAELAALLRRREEAFAAAGVDSVATYRRQRAEGRFADDPHGDVFLVVDGWSTIRAEFEDQEAAIVDLANRGLTFGIHVVATAGRWMDVRHTVRDVFGTKLELRLGDPTDSMINRRVAVNVPENAPGRGLTADAAHFLAALPRFESSSAADGTESLVKTVADIRTAWDGPLAPRVRLLPRQVPHDMLPSANGAGVPIGIAEVDLRPVHVDFTADAHFLVFGDAECGKSTFLRDLAHRLIDRYSPAEARIVVVDHRRSLLGVVPETHRAGYGSSADSTAAIAREVAKAMRARVPGPDVTPEQLKDRSWWTGPEVFVLVDDYDLVTAATPNPLAPLAEFLPLARDVGLHLVVARRSGGASRAMFEQLMQRLKELNTPGLMMSGNRDEGALLGTVKGSPLPPGRAWLVTRRAGPRLIQLANRP
ncbi:type VII secretion protein EccCa [Virgisporangium aurantiacum]|uniref:Type VII secretion protein EccC n=1 Tax=Virgisporangium aurantiacum TaxID=175570 RepID=A0A8J4DZQ5_9ACTN|nr:type VII secretion protein EccCa [Virgisporangium aurantiacum]GIJ55961.1 type VII secretion protein EccC [Virgisporangium aurantiacum]